AGRRRAFPERRGAAPLDGRAPVRRTPHETEGTRPRARRPYAPAIARLTGRGRRWTGGRGASSPGIGTGGCCTSAVAWRTFAGSPAGAIQGGGGGGRSVP